MDPSIAFSAGRWLLLATTLTCRGISVLGPAGVPADVMDGPDDGLSLGLELGAEEVASASDGFVDGE
jgi:hypothetical protein